MPAPPYRILFSTLLATVLLSWNAQAAPLYKCELDGTLAFQDAPCPPLKAKQKVACADVDGFAVYQDALQGACHNLPAGTPTNAAAAAKKSTPNAKSAKTSVKTGHPSKAQKAVLVRAHTKEDGTQVPSYTRSLPGDKAK